MIEPTDTEVKVAELRELLAKATPGPWDIFDGCSWRRIGNRDDDCAVLYPYNANDGHPDLASRGANTHANLKLIVAAVNSLPELLDALDTARLATRSPVADVEAVARAIDPGQWAVIDRWWPYRGTANFDDRAEYMRTESLNRARAAIATLSPQGATDAK